MARLRNIKGVLNNFLGTFTSRYSDYDGYWIFGLLYGDLEQLTIDLLNPEVATPGITPVSAARQLAREKFADQMVKAGLATSSLQEASLEISKQHEPVMGPVNGRSCAGRTINFRVVAFFKSGKRYESDKSIFVAPHNPEIEGRSTRRT